MSRLVCICSFVEEKEIVAALKKGAVTTSDIQKVTGAGTTCGRCLPEIDDLVGKYGKKKAGVVQNKLDF